LNSNHPQEERPIRAIFFNASLASLLGKEDGGRRTTISPFALEIN